MEIQLSQQKSKTVKFTPFTYSINTTRVFNCNQLYIKNYGTGNVILNNSYQLLPGEFIELFSNLNEVDTTVYQFHFSPGGAVKGWFKQDSGISERPTQKEPERRKAPKRVTSHTSSHTRT